MIWARKANDTDAWITYNRLRGQHSSAMEHAIPERFFDDPNDTQTAEGVSAVKALAVAVSQGQKIFTITQANQAQLANIQQSSAVMESIRDALNAGKEVTIHERPISYAGFNGVGYVITDPLTGAGAYLIEGGANGGSLSEDLGPVLIFAAMTLLGVGDAQANEGEVFADSLKENNKKFLDNLKCALGIIGPADSMDIGFMWLEVALVEIVAVAAGALAIAAVIAVTLLIVTLVRYYMCVALETTTSRRDRMVV